MLADSPQPTAHSPRSPIPTRWAVICRLLAVGCGLPLLIAPAAPCITLPRAGTRVSGDVKVCPGTYRIADPRKQGVLIVAG